MDHDDIRSFAEPDAANNPELRNCSGIDRNVSRGGFCGISPVGR
jgi:hypothetical protein